MAIFLLPSPYSYLNLCALQKGSGSLKQKSGPKAQASKSEKPITEEKGGKKKKGKSGSKAATPEPKEGTATAKKDGKGTKAATKPQVMTTKDAFFPFKCFF